MMRKTEKLAAAARLAATMAHEINNPLAAVLNLVFVARSAPDTSPFVVQQLMRAEQELERVAHITRQSLGFYRESNAPERVEPAALMDSVLRIYAGRIQQRNIEIVKDFGSCPAVKVVAGELKQAFANLISNAIDAVGTNGVIVISARGVNTVAGETVEVVVADSGPGIAPEYLDRIFEPFFTTKKDVGTGLGLWVTKEIIERHGGKIDVRPHMDGDAFHGAAFIVQLPCAPQMRPNAAKAELNGTTATADPR
jgi:signal transduction histidine kinase